MLKLAVVSALLLMSLAGTMLVLSHKGEITVTAQCGTEVTFSPSDGVLTGFFGRSVSIDGTNAVIGAYQDNAPSTYSGSAYVFSEVSPGTWVQVAKLVASDGAASDLFGHTVAISGPNAIIGAYWDDDKGDSSGSAYIFSEQSPGNWVQVAKLVASDGVEGDRFGYSVAIDGSNVVIGSPFDNSNGFNSGSTYVFSELSAGTWVQVIRLAASDPASSDYFGDSVAVDGNNALIGAWSDDDVGFNGGSAYIFSEISAGSWVEVAKLVASDGAEKDEFGWSVAISGTNALIGAYYDEDLGYRSGSAYVFSEISPGNWVQVAKLLASDGAAEDWFGCSVAIDGTNAAVGACYDDDMGSKSGSVYRFSELSTGNWIQVAKLLATDGDNNHEFGNSVSLSSTRMLVGSYKASTESAYNAGSVYFYFLDDVDDCPGNACEHGSTCMDALYDYCCVCPVAYSGTLCTDCLCENGGVCQDDPLGIGYCDCSSVQYSGNTCTKFCNNGVGETYPDTGCNCTLSGATGKFCTEDVDDCESSPCANGGTCTDYGADLFPNHNNEFNCSCDGTGYHGVACEISDCTSSPCLNDGVCEQVYDLDGPIGIQCNCSDPSYEGEFCQNEVDECASSPCFNDGNCTDLLGDFTCDCTGTGYEGLTCTDDLDDCMSSPCQNDGTCEDKGANKFKCTCNEFWEGDTCSDDVDDCILKGYYCENGAVCADDPVSMGDVICDCSTSTGGFTGKYCDVPIEDACVTFNPCANGGKCFLDDITKAMSCDCANTGYEGDVCDVQVYVSECVSSPCLNEGQCYDPSDYQDDWYCVCINAYFGDLCDLQACDSMPCQNGGTCANEMEGSYICTCPENYSGAQCQVDDDEQVQQGSSSSSIPEAQDDLVSGDDDNTAKNDNGMLIIIIVVLAVLVVVVGGIFCKKKQSAKSFTMPT